MDPNDELDHHATQVYNSRMENKSQRTFQFVGGSQDGNEVPVGEPYDVGVQIPLPLRNVANKREIYEMESDGKFHFRRFEDSLSIDIVQPNVNAMKPIVTRLAAALKELDTLFSAQGGWHGPLVLGKPDGSGRRWTLRAEGKD